MTGVSGPGAVAAGLTTTTGTATRQSSEISPNHRVCKNCHGMNSPTDAEATYNVTSMWGGAGFHGNGSLDMNGPSAQQRGTTQTAAGAEYNGNDDAALETSDYSCTKACHQGADNDNNNMGDSGWALKYGDYGAGDCNSCHGYPPLTAADFAAKRRQLPGRASRHRLRRLRRRRRRAQRARPPRDRRSSAAHGWTPCLPCHPSTSHMTTDERDAREHQRRRFAAPPTTPRAARPTSSPAASPAAASCANVSCHGGQTTPFWDGGTINVATQCTPCHAVEPVANQAAATQWNSACSGLHGRAGSVSLENHTAADASVGDLTDSQRLHPVPRAARRSTSSGMDTRPRTRSPTPTS